MKGTINSIDEKSTKTGRYYYWVTIDGDKYSCWQEMIAPFVVGDIVEFDWKKSDKGDYKNLTAMEPIKDTNQVQRSGFDKTKIWNTCLMCAKDIVVAEIEKGSEAVNTIGQIKDFTINLTKSFYNANTGNEEEDIPY